MNFYYGSDKIDWREFRERINRETDNDCLRNAILAWMIGIVSGYRRILLETMDGAM